MKAELNRNISVCITNYNKVKYIKQSMQSFLPFFNSLEAEVIVVDAGSTDGSLEILKSYKEDGKIQKLIIRPCSRGRGRDIAFRESNGNLIVSSIDTDVIYDVSVLKKAIELYTKNYHGKVFAIYGSIIGDMEVFNEIGGWNDLDRHEDNEISLRALEAGKYIQDFSLNAVKDHLKDREKMNLFDSIKLTYTDYRDWFRLGLRLRQLKSKDLIKPHVLLAYARALKMQRYPSPVLNQYLKMIGWHS
jgi:glycosyltransferase involved in cell wall biosynthesis